MFSSWKSENVLFGKELTLCHKIPTFTTLKVKAFENIVGKEENTVDQYCLLFPLFSILFAKTEIFNLTTVNLSFANAFNSALSKLLSVG